MQENIFDKIWNEPEAFKYYESMFFLNCAPPDKLL